METGFNVTSPLTSLVSSIKQQLKITVSDEDIFLMKLVNDGIGSLDALSIMVLKNCDLTVENGMAKLPNGFNKLLSVCTCSELSSIDSDGNPVTTYNWGQLYYVDRPFLTRLGVNVNDANLSWVDEGTYQIQGNYIVLSNIAAGQDEDGNIIPVTKIRLACLCLNVDTNGMFYSYDRYERALTAYGCWKYTLQNFDRYNQYIIQEYKSEWTAQKAYIKSIEQQNQFNNTKRQMAAAMNAWISAKVWHT